MNYRGVLRRTEHRPYYVWEEPLSKWEDDEFEDDRVPRHIKQVEQEEHRGRKYER